MGKFLAPTMPRRAEGWLQRRTPTTSRLCSSSRPKAASASMRIDGRWHLFRDGVLRPVVDAAVQKPSGSWQAVMFLLDAGADRTVFDQTFLTLLAALARPADATPELGGVGGKVDCIFIE